MCMPPFESGPEPGTYRVTDLVSEQDIMEMASSLVKKRFERGMAIKAPQDTHQYLAVTLAEKEHEVFGLIYLDGRHCVLAMELLFRGTVDTATIYPREIVKQILAVNAAAVILFHNHPSGIAEPSSADQRITNRIVKALETIDVRVLDHIVLGGHQAVSFAERGLL